jgi:hypothetical protein
MLSSDTREEIFLQLCDQGYARGERPVRLLGVGVRVDPIESADALLQLDLEPQ